MSIGNRRSRVLVLNGALGGGAGNTAVMLRRATRALGERAEVDVCTLADEPDASAALARVATADALLVATGVYWDSWGSPLQRFFEEATPTEGTATWLGKPAGALVTMHSVGGKAVLSRLMGVLNTLGAYVPPMGGMVFSLANQLALAHAGDDDAADLWCEDDLDVVCHNLLEATEGTKRWRAWGVDRRDARRRWMSE